MKKIVLGLVLVVSFGFAETARGLGSQLLSNADNIYRLDVTTKTCNKVIKKEKEIGFITDVWRDGGIKAINKAFYFKVIDIGQEQAGNGKYLLVSGLKNFSIYMVNNKQWCNKVAQGNPFGQIENIIQQEFGTDKKLSR